MKILGIETSCDETAAAVIETTRSLGRVKILSSVVASQIKLHAKTGGVVPEVAARAHIENIIPVINRALNEARIKNSGLDLIAVTSGPGLITSLMVGVDTARVLSTAWDIPIIATNHVEGHAFSALISESQIKNHKTKNIFPALSLVVSGGHTDLILIKNWHEFKKIGQTVDDAAGEAFDKIAKIIGLPYPGGPAISRLAQWGNPQAFDFPRPMLHSHDFNFSFSGLKTAALYQIIKDKKEKKINARYKADIAASVQRAIVDVLISKTIAAAKKYHVKTILLGGGVAANKILRAELASQGNKQGIKTIITPAGLCTDNAAMIAYVGALHASKKKFTLLAKLKANSNWEL